MTTTEVASLPAAGEPPKASGLSIEELQHLVDQVAGFQLLAAPERPVRDLALRARGGLVIGFEARETLRRFETDLELPSSGGTVRAVNAVGEAVGSLHLRWLLVPHDFLARPDREPPPTLLDRTRSQRFAMQEATFRFSDGRDGFRSFGTGRTFPFAVAGRPRLVAAAVGNLTQGFGNFTGCEGNFTLCGEINAEHGFVGHILARIVDPGKLLRTAAGLPQVAGHPNPDPESAYLVWGAQKGRGPQQENRFSLNPSGQVRGLNIPVALKHLHLDLAVDGGAGFRAGDFRTGEVIGQEVGFGRGADPSTGPEGTALKPFLFEGVARYGLNDTAGHVAGALTTNVLEGRRFDVRLAGAPEEQAWRFGFFGPVVAGSGCFRGAQGMFYGASGSILRPPPGAHIITHFYAARLFDPTGQFHAVRLSL